MRRFTIFLLASTLFAGSSATAAPVAEQHQNANVYAFWDFETESGFRDAEQRLKVRQKAPFTFWAQYWRWDGFDVGGYIGLQTDGKRFDGTTGETAIFSLWDASNAEGPGCGTFGGEGEGYSCRLAFPIRTKRTYRLVVKRASASDKGQWWKGSVQDLSNGKTHAIGRILVAAEFKEMGHPMNFSEYFGPAVGCDEVPLSIALWSSPRANREDGRYRFTSRRAGSTRGECTGGSVEAHRFGTQGVKVTQGGPL